MAKAESKVVESTLLRSDGTTAPVKAIVTPQSAQTQEQRDKGVKERFAARLAAKNKKQPKPE